MVSFVYIEQRTFLNLLTALLNNDFKSNDDQSRHCCLWNQIKQIFLETYDSQNYRCSKSFVFIENEAVFFFYSAEIWTRLGKLTTGNKDYNCLYKIWKLLYWKSFNSFGRVMIRTNILRESRFKLNLFSKTRFQTQMQRILQFQS